MNLYSYNIVFGNKSSAFMLCTVYVGLCMYVCVCVYIYQTVYRSRPRGGSRILERGGGEVEFHF